MLLMFKVPISASAVASARVSGVVESSVGKGCSGDRSGGNCPVSCLFLVHIAANLTVTMFEYDGAHRGNEAKHNVLITLKTLVKPKP